MVRGRRKCGKCFFLVGGAVGGRMGKKEKREIIDIHVYNKHVNCKQPGLDFMALQNT